MIKILKKSMILSKDDILNILVNQFWNKKQGNTKEDLER